MNKVSKLIISTVTALSFLFIPCAALAEDVDYSAGTHVLYNENTSEEYTVTVPAQMAPSETAYVTVHGTWASNRKLVVTSENSVILSNSINPDKQKVLTVTFEGIEKEGSNTDSVSHTQEISVSEIGDKVYGAWEGSFHYDVEMMDIDQIVSIDNSDQYSNEADGSENLENVVVDPDGNNAYTKVYYYLETPICEVTICLTDKHMNLIEGGVLQILDNEGNIVHEFASVVEGYKVELEIGTYTLHIIDPPMGYEFAEDIEFTLEEGDSPNIVMVLQYIKVLVSSGGQGTMITAIVALCLAVTSIYLIVIGKKKSSKENT